MNERQEHPGRPPRLASYFSASPLFFVTFNTWMRQPILAYDTVHEAFVRFAEKGHAMGRAAVGRYVIMPDHVHLFVRGGSTFELPEYVKIVKQVLGKSVVVSPGYEKIWQPGFFDHVLRSDESYEEKWEYVRANPVRAGLVDTPEAWLYQGEIVSLEY